MKCCGSVDHPSLLSQRWPLPRGHRKTEPQSHRKSPSCIASGPEPTERPEQFFVHAGLHREIGQSRSRGDIEASAGPEFLTDGEPDDLVGRVDHDGSPELVVPPGGTTQTSGDPPCQTPLNRLARRRVARRHRSLTDVNSCYNVALREPRARTGRILPILIRRTESRTPLILRNGWSIRKGSASWWNSTA